MQAPDSGSLINTENDVNSVSKTQQTSEVTDVTDIEAKIPCWRRYCGPIREGSLRGSTLAMASITFGSGCLAFPYAVAQTGPVIALIFFIAVAIANYYTLYILLDAGIKTKTMDYNGLVVKTMGKKMDIFYDINNFILCLGVIMSYQYIVYEFALDLLSDFFGVERTNLNKLYIMLACMICVQIPMNLLKDISKLQYASIVGTIALVYSILLIVAEMPFYLTTYLSTKPFPSLFRPLSWNYLDTFSTFMFGFCAHNGIFQVFDELSRPSVKRYHKVLNRSFVIELFLYTSIAFAGFFSTFYDTDNYDLFLSRPDLPSFKPDYLMKVSKITLIICLHCTMAINNNIMRQSTKSMCFGGQDIPFTKDLVIVIITYVVSNGLVYFVSSISRILGIIGGFCTVVISFVNPVLIHVFLSELPSSDPKNLFRFGFLAIMTLLGTASTIKSIIDFIKEIKI
jgi:amino acid permease